MLRPVPVYPVVGIRDGVYGMESQDVGTSGEVAIASCNGRSTSCPSEWTATFEDFTGDRIYVKSNELAVVVSQVKFVSSQHLFFNLACHSNYVSHGFEF